MSTPKKSSSLERRVEGYLKPANYAFMRKYIENHSVSCSSAVNDAVQALRDKQTPPPQAKTA